jgi:alkylresorcinol/alkylpyrone synthase
MFITGLGTAVPEKLYSQRQCLESLRAAPQYARLAAPSRMLLERVLGAGEGVQTRHLALESLSDAFELDPDVLYRRYFTHAPELATRAARKALDDAGATPAEIDALVISTCTGYLCPGLTSYVAERLGLRNDALLLDLVGQGCGAALPNLRTAEALLAAQRCGRVLSACVEVCSAALYIDDDPGVLISACLFGDGAAAAVTAPQPRKDARSVRWTGATTVADPNARGTLRMEQRGGLLRNILSRSVPQVAAEHASSLLSSELQKRELTMAEIRAWIWHAGGRTVLERLRSLTGLGEEATRRSADILGRFGNLSSPFVLFVLAQTLRERAPDGWWWMSSFGAGFSCHGALLEVSAA